MPATYKFSIGVDVEKDFNDRVLAQVVETMRPEYDFIFLDAQAGSDKCSQMCMNRCISDEVIIVAEYDPLSAAGVERLKQVVGEDLGYARTWVLLNKMLPEYVAKFSEFLSVAKYLPPIPWNADVVRAYARRKTALDLDAGNEFTLAIMRTIESLLGDYIRDDLESWSQTRTSALKAPLDEQCELAEAQLAQALKSKRLLTRRYRLRAFVWIYFIAAGIAAGIASIFTVIPEIDGSLAFSDSTLIIITMMLTMVGLFWTTNIVVERKDTTESARYDRSIERLKENLKQLEAMRSANYETLIKKLNTE